MTELEERRRPWALMIAGVMICAGGLWLALNEPPVKTMFSLLLSLSYMSVPASSLELPASVEELLARARSDSSMGLDLKLVVPYFLVASGFGMGVLRRSGLVFGTGSRLLMATAAIAAVAASVVTVVTWHSLDALLQAVPNATSVGASEFLAIVNASDPLTTSHWLVVASGVCLLGASLSASSPATSGDQRRQSVKQILVWVCVLPAWLVGMVAGVRLGLCIEYLFHEAHLTENEVVRDLSPAVTFGNLSSGLGCVLATGVSWLVFGIMLLFPRSSSTGRLVPVDER